MVYINRAFFRLFSVSRFFKHIKGRLLGSVSVISLKEHDRVHDGVGLFNAAESEYATQPWVCLLVAVRHSHPAPRVNVKTIQNPVLVDDHDKS